MVCHLAHGMANVDDNRGNAELVPTPGDKIREFLLTSVDYVRFPRLIFVVYPDLLGDHNRTGYGIPNLLPELPLLWSQLVSGFIR